MWIEIEPIDTLFFRDGKPFFMGEDVWADTIFPPFPSTIYGALRTLYFTHHPDEIGNAGTENDPTRKLEIRNILLKVEGKYYLPLPSDIVKNKNDEDSYSLLSTSERNDFSSNYPLKCILTPPAGRKVKSVSGAWIEVGQFQRYLQGEVDPSGLSSSIVHQSDLIVDEPKIGIARDRTTRTSEEHKIYRVGMIRIKRELSFVVELEGLDIPNKALIKLGAENRMTYYNKRMNKPPVSIPEAPKIGKRFKLVLATPAYFQNGWYPGGTEAENGYTWNLNGTKAELIAASVSRYIPIGGYDMKERKPKEMKRYVPAGSVYYFEILEGKSNAFADVHGNSISDERANEGFGISYIAKI